MAEDEKAAEPIGSRRGQKTLPPLQTQLDSAPLPPSSFWRRSRSVVPPPPEHSVPPPQQPVPNPPAKLENRKSAVSLFSLFNRPKVERARGHHEVGLPTIPDAPEAQPTIALSPVAATHNTLGKPAEQRAMTPKSRGGSRRSRTSGSSNWEPSPLSQAYPQAVKHATLQATNASAETIISTQAHKRQYSILKENFQSKLDLSNGGDEAIAASEKLSKREKRMSTSSAQGAPDMTLKVYVLSTAGYLLQYSGEGPPDRMPEKVLQLGKDSAAFACDLIPGKHWVLQISQSTTDDGTPTTQQPRGLFSRLRQSTAAKRTATNLLLVFDTPEEMGEWLTAIRQEIDILAGRRTRSEVDQENDQEDGLRQFTKMPTQRYYVGVDPSRFDSERSPITSPVGSPANPSMEWSNASMRRNVSDAASTTSRFTFKRRSVEGSSMATTSVSYDGSQLNQLREDSRLSMASNRTSGTSPATSTGPPSPVRDSTPLPGDEIQRSPTTLRSFSMSPSTSSRRKSMQPLSPSNEDQARNSQRLSTFGAALAGARKSPAPPSEDGHKSPVPDGSAPRSIKNRMSFSRPFNLHTLHNHAPMPTIRSASAPPEKMTMPAGQAVSTDEAESTRPPSILGSLPSAATLSSTSVHRQTPLPNPGYRPVSVKSTSFMPARRSTSLGPALPVNVDPTPALRQRASQPQLPTQIPPQLASPPPRKPLPPTPAPPPTMQLPPTPQQPQSKHQQPLRRPTSMQVRSEPVAFLSTRRPMGVSTRNRAPSMEPPVRPSSAQPPTYYWAGPARPSSAQPANYWAGAARLSGQPRLSVVPSRSMPVLGLPPPAPPPNMPLPAPPPNVPLPPPPTSVGSTATIKTTLMA